MHIRPFIIVAFLSLHPVCCAEPAPVGSIEKINAADQEIAYQRAIADRAKRIVSQLELKDGETAARVQKLVAEQYYALRKIHDPPDGRIARDPEASETPLDDSHEQVKQLATIEQFQLHRQFIAQLSVELNSEQVTGIKNGMTYGVVPVTYARYLKLLPNLKNDEKKHIKALLIEAREYAMDGGSSEEKHGWFRKYKGKINNYVSERGFDLAAAELTSNGDR